MKNDQKEKVIGVIGAMQIEIDGLRAHMTHKCSQVVSGITFVSGRLGGTRVVTAVCGIGKVFAALCAEAMILTYEPTVIINTGVGGTLTDQLSIGQIAVAQAVVQHDMDTSAIGDPVGLVSGVNMIYFPADRALSDRLVAVAERLGLTAVSGTIASGDQFISEGQRKRWIADTFGAIACEMEGAAIGHVCYVNGVPFAVLRAISDGGDEDARMDYPTFARMAAENSIRILTQYLTELFAEQEGEV